MVRVQLSELQWSKVGAVHKSKALAKRRMELENGATRIAASALSDAVEGYYKDAANRPRPSTVGLYRKATDTFLEWAKRRRIATGAALKASALPTFRDCSCAP